MVRQSSVHSHLRGDVEGVREGLDIVGWAVGLLEVGDVEGENEGETLGLRDGEKEGRTLGESWDVFLPVWAVLRANNKHDAIISLIM